MYIPRQFLTFVSGKDGTILPAAQALHAGLMGSALASAQCYREA